MARPRRRAKVNQLLARQIEEAVGTIRDGPCCGLGCEAQLRVAAATVSDAPPGLITAATVVGILGQDDVPAVEAMVSDIANQFQLKTDLRVHLGSFSVRFSRRQDQREAP
jgi:hypothetical protein